MFETIFTPHTEFDFDQMNIEKSRLKKVWKPRYAGVNQDAVTYNYVVEYKMLSKHKELLSAIVEKYAKNFQTSKQSESQFRTRFWNVVGFLYTTLFKTGFEHNHIDSRVLKAVNQNYYQIFDILIDEHILVINNNYMTASYIKSINNRRAGIAAVFHATKSQIQSTQMQKHAYTQSYSFTYKFIQMEKKAKIERDYCWTPMTFEVSTYVYQFITMGIFYLPTSKDKGKAEVIVSSERRLKDEKFCESMPEFYKEGDARNWYNKRIFSLTAFEKRNELSEEELEKIAENEHDLNLKAVKAMGYDKLEFDEKLFQKVWSEVEKSDQYRYSEVDKARIVSELKLMGKTEPQLIYNRIYTPFHRIPSVFRKCIRFKGQKIVQAYDSKCNVIRMLVKVIAPFVEKKVKFLFYERVGKSSEILSKRALEKDEFILSDKYVMKTHKGELFITKKEFKDFYDFCNSDDPYMIPIIAFTCDTPDNVAWAKYFPYYDHEHYQITRSKMKKAFQQFINSNPCAYAFYDQKRYNAAVSIVTRFFFRAFPEISLFIQYGSYVGSAKKKMLWPHIEANEFKYISSQLHDCLKDYGYDSITVHDAVYMGEQDYKKLTNEGLDISDLFEAIIDHSPNSKYPARASLKPNAQMFEREYVREPHSVEDERILFKDPSDDYEKERQYVEFMKAELKTKHKDWIFDPLWERNQKDKRRASAYRKMQTHLKHYLNELIVKDYIEGEYKEFFNDIEHYEVPGMMKTSKTYSNVEEMEKDFYNPDGFIQKCKKGAGGINTYSINGLTVTFAAMQTPLEKMIGSSNKSELKFYKKQYLEQYKIKFKDLLEKRREELKQQYFDGLKVSSYDRWKADHPKEAAEHEHASSVLIDESSIAALYGSMLKRKWDPEKDAEKISIFKEVKQLKKNSQKNDIKNVSDNELVDIFSL